MITIQNAGSRLKTPMLGLLLALPSLASAYEVNDKLDLTTALRGLFQYGDYSNAVDAQGQPLNSTARGAGILDLTVEYRPTSRDTLYAAVRFASGNALNDVGGVALSPYADPLEEELRDINGSGRDSILEAWYRHGFELTDDTSLALTAGIINAGDQLGENAFADDSDTQFMNEVLETSNINMLSYMPGAILELEHQEWSLNLVYTQSENEAGARFNWVSSQLSYRLETDLGEGNYRFFAFTSDGAFADADGTRDDERFQGLGLSFDQELGDIFGAFVRVIWGGDNAVVDFNRLVSGGVNISGRAWGRAQDNAGIGYAYVEGPPGSELQQANVAEAYVRFQLTRLVDVTLDLQYQDNRARIEDSGGGDADDNDGLEAYPGDPSAWIAGLRVNLIF